MVKTLQHALQTIIRYVMAGWPGAPGLLVGELYP